MKREIWFYKFGWSYLPCHWKGWVVTATMAISTILLVFLAQALLDSLRVPGAHDWPALLMIVAVVVGCIVAKRHS